MLDTPTRAAIASALGKAYRTRQPLPLLTQTWPDIDIDDAYAIQQSFIAAQLAAGRTIRGYKVGLTSQAMQEMAGSTEPNYSAMTDDRFPPEDTPMRAGRFFHPLIEIEVAFVLKHALKGPGVLPVDVIRATDFILPSIEIVDFRIGPVLGMTVVDAVADLAAFGAAVLGANPRRLDQVDLRTMHGAMLINGEVVQAGFANAVLGNPVTSIAWLANRLGSLGVNLEPGQIILSGSFVRAMPVKAGDEVIARFDQGLGDVKTMFT